MMGSGVHFGRIRIDDRLVKGGDSTNGSGARVLAEWWARKSKYKKRKGRVVGPQPRGLNGKA